MNAHQRRTHRRAFPGASTCGLQGYSGTTLYPDLMCQDGHMRDMDADGYDPSTFAPPCRNCHPAEYQEWVEGMEEEEADEEAMA